MARQARPKCQPIKTKTLTRTSLSSNTMHLHLSNNTILHLNNITTLHLSSSTIKLQRPIRTSLLHHRPSHECQLLNSRCHPDSPHPSRCHRLTLGSLSCKEGSRASNVLTHDKRRWDECPHRTVSTQLHNLFTIRTDPWVGRSEMPCSRSMVASRWQLQELRRRCIIRTNQSEVRWETQ